MTCVYCEAENVLGLDMRRDARAARSSETTLEQALRDRARSRWTARLVALGGTVVIVAVALYLARR